MADAPIMAPMPADLDLPDGYIVRFSARDATTNAEVSGVVVSNVSIFGTALGALDGGIFGPFKLVPGPGA